jgi:hypothetical protein
LSCLGNKFHTVVCFQAEALHMFITEKLSAAPAAALTSYLSQRVIPLLRSNAALGRPAWTSNNVESMNHVLKNVTNWRLQKLPDLVQSIKAIVAVQQRNAERAMYCEGKKNIIYLFFCIHILFTTFA